MADFRDLRIVVIGAGMIRPFHFTCRALEVISYKSLGMGGLGTALAFARKGFKKIDVFETASNLGFVGAGIQMPPNVVRVLDRLGVREPIQNEATNVKATSIRRKSPTNPPPPFRLIF